MAHESRCRGALTQYRSSFVRATEVGESHPSNLIFERSLSGNSLSGGDIRQFYEGLFSNEASLDQKGSIDAPLDAISAPNASQRENFGVLKHVTRKKQGPINISAAGDRKVAQCCNKILKYSSNGDHSELRKLLQEIRHYNEESLILNAQDSYGWNPLMCAAADGHHIVVSMLLTAGCNVTAANISGMNVYDVARACRQTAVLDVLNGRKKRTFPKPDDVSAITTVKPDSLVKCDLCEEWYNPIHRKAHEASIVHMFKEAKQYEQYDCFGLPTHNKGFQMLLRSGWDQKSGLGPSGAGIKHPLSPKQKYDRGGLGLRKKEKRSNVSRSLLIGPLKSSEIKIDTLKRPAHLALQSKHWKDKQFEICFRNQFKVSDS